MSGVNNALIPLTSGIHNIRVTPFTLVIYDIMYFIFTIYLIISTCGRKTCRAPGEEDDLSKENKSLTLVYNHEHVATTGTNRKTPK